VGHTATIVPYNVQWDSYYSPSRKLRGAGARGAVDIVTGYGLDGRGSILARGKTFLFSVASRPALSPTQHPIQWVPGAIFPRVKQQGRDTDHLPPSTAEVTNYS
jgi:hypothetical protein